MKIFVNSFYYPIYTLGPGIRIGLWLQGCSIKCKNCISPHTWYVSSEHEMDVQELAEKINFIPCPKLTISGGEPLDQVNSLIYLLKLIRKTKNDILLYTGYELEKYIQKHKDIWEELRYLVDVIIDGPFMWGKETEYIWKGSENQKMYILNEKLLPVYEEYKNRTKNKNLQIIEYQNSFLLVGIPYQRDYEKLIELKRSIGYFRSLYLRSF